MHSYFVLSLLTRWVYLSRLWPSTIIFLWSSLTAWWTFELTLFYFRISTARMTLSCWLHLMNSFRWDSIECVASSVQWPDYLSCQMESLDITIKLPLTLEYNQLCIKLSSCDVKSTPIIYLKSVTQRTFERLESLFRNNCCLSSLFEDGPISNFHNTAPEGHDYIIFSTNSWNMSTIGGFLFLMISLITSFNVAGYDQLMKFLDLSQQQHSSDFFSTVVVLEVT